MDANRKTDRKKDMEKMEAKRRKDKEDLMEKLDIYQAKTDAVLLAMQVMESSHKGIVAETKPETGIKTMACQEMGAHPEEEEPTSVDMKPEAAEQSEVPVQDATVMPVGEPKKKRRRDQRLAAERRRHKLKNSTWENGAPQKELAVACRKMSRCVTVA
jgi:hypothetical protein